MGNLLILKILIVVGCFGFPNLSAYSNSKRIIYGKHADLKSFPYSVPLCLFINDRYTYFCAGSLITTNFVLTAAHCLIYDDKVTVFARKEGHSETSETQYVKAKQCRPHEKFKMKLDTLYDIGLVELLNSIEPQSGMTTVKLPSKSDTNLTYMNYKAVATGWGKTKHGMSKGLKYLNITIVSNDKCPFNYKEKERLCGKGNKCGRVCHGDSGGPLVIENAHKEIIQIGVVSGGNKNCTQGFGAFYTRVTRFLDWIEEHSNYKFQ